MPGLGRRNAETVTDGFKREKVMKTGMTLTAVAVVLAVAACSKREDPELNVPGAAYNKQTGVLTTKEGIQLNAQSATNTCVSPGDAQRPASSFSPEERLRIVTCFNTQTADQLNPQLPRQIDQITRLDRVGAEGPVLNYYYTVSLAAASLGPNAAQQIEAGTRRQSCSQPGVAQSLEMGRIYAYRYVDKDGQLIHSFRLTSCSG